MAEDNITAIVAQQRDTRNRHSWMWLFDRLRDCIDVVGCRPEDDAKLHDEDLYFECKVMTDPKGEIGPDIDILAMFRENPSLWLEACPLPREEVVVLPREIAKRIIGALPISTKPGEFHHLRLEQYEEMGADWLHRAADQRRYMREQKEREAGERTRELIEDTLLAAKLREAFAPQSERPSPEQREK